MSRPAEAPRSQLDHELAMKLHDAGTWLTQCSIGQCATNGGPLLVQGGPDGLSAHLATVHASEEVPALF